MVATNIEEISQFFHQQFAENRGLTTEQLAEMTHPRMAQLHDFHQAEHADEFITYLHDHADKVITIFGDYDADGVLATTVAYRGLQTLNIGSKVNVHVPTRADGYGISPSAVDKLMAKFPDTEIILTVDNGVVGFDGVAHAKSLGLDVVVSDHHLGTDTDTQADVVVDINRPSDHYPFKGLSGTGVIFKLWVLYAQTYEPTKLPEIYQFMDLVGVSVVSDVMPVIDENRVFLTSALRSIQNDGRPQWTTLKQVLDTYRMRVPNVIDETFIGFTLAPIINSANRVTDSPAYAYRVFMTEQPKFMTDYWTELVALNNHRKDDVNAMTKALTEQVYATYDTIPDALVIVADMRLGYMGLIANSLMTEFNVPVIVASETHDGISHGSARSFGSYHLVNALKDAPHVLTVGGHAQAGGVSFKTVDRADVEREFAEAIRSQRHNDTPDDNQPVSDLTLTFDANQQQWTWRDKIVPLPVIVSLVAEMSQYRPYGQQFPEPVVVLENVEIDNYFAMSQGLHSKFTAGGISFIKWRDNGALEKRVGETMTIVGQLSLNEFRGNVSPQVILR